MNWISLLSQFFFASLVTSAAGSMMFLFWFLCSRFLWKLNPKLVYSMLKWVIAMFLLPIAYLGIMKNHKTGYVQNMGNMLFVMDFNNLLFQVITWLWTIAIIFILFLFLKNEAGKYWVCKSNFDDGNSLEQREFDRIKKKLGIKSNVKLLRNDNLKQRSPFVCGIWNQKVVLPYLEYSKEELNVIFHHELNHVKKSDVIFRYLTMFAIILNSMNPFSYFLWKRVQLWAEADCDARTIDSLKEEGISKRQYYDIIWKMKEENSAKPIFFSCPMLLSASEIFYRRIHIMKNYSSNKICTAKGIMIGIVALFAVISSGIALMAGFILAEAGDNQLREEQIVEYLEEEDTSLKWSEEMLLKADNIPYSVGKFESQDVCSGTISWDIPSGKRYVTESVYIPKMAEVQMAFLTEQKDCRYQFGLLYPNYERVVIEGTGIGCQSFDVSENGYYRILIENHGEQVLHIVGNYLY